MQIIGGIKLMMAMLIHYFYYTLSKQSRLIEMRGGGGGVNEILIENVWMELYVNMEIFILKNIKKTPYVTHKHNGIFDRHLKDVSKHAKLRRVTVVFQLFLSYDRMVTPSCHIDHALYCTRSVWSIINTCDNSNKV